MSAAELENLKLVESIRQVRSSIATARTQGLKIALVPTMGALHEGHLSLIRAARQAADYVAVSIFVNPTQFGPHEDFERYPRPLEDDLYSCAEEGVDLVFHPETETIYPTGDETIVNVQQLSTNFEGTHRPGHFQGVSTVVLKLLNIVAPDCAFFGRKDYQQQLIIRQMCRDLRLPIEIVTCPTIREADGLALSSRNQYLTAEERQTALSLHGTLQMARDLILQDATDLKNVRHQMVRQMEETAGIELDYATVADAETLLEPDRQMGPLVALIAARVGTTRLIDNIPIE